MNGYDIASSFIAGGALALAISYLYEEKYTWAMIMALVSVFNILMALI